MSKSPYDYRLRIVEPQQSHPMPYVTYIVRKGDDVRYMDSDETPLALSNLIHREAAAMRFTLEDALDGAAAAKALREVLAGQFKGNLPLCPKVEVLS